MTAIGFEALVERAQNGDRSSFDILASEYLRPLRSIVRRMIGHPEDTDDVVQEALLKAWKAIGSFRSDSSFGTWLGSIGARAAVDHLRERKRWRERAQIAYSNACSTSEVLGGQVFAVFMSPDFQYEAREHVSYCFTCVGRSLPPEQQAALVLREVMGFSAREAADALGVSEPVFRHQLSGARRTMETAFEGLCSLVNKNGVCYQCKGLREATPEGRRSGPIPEIESFDERLEIVRGSDVDGGASQMLHDLFWRRTCEIEEKGAVPDEAMTDCGQD